MVEQGGEGRRDELSHLSLWKCDGFEPCRKLVPSPLTPANDLSLWLCSDLRLSSPLMWLLQMREGDSVTAWAHLHRGPRRQLLGYPTGAVHIITQINEDRWGLYNQPYPAASLIWSPGGISP